MMEDAQVRERVERVEELLGAIEESPAAVDAVAAVVELYADQGRPLPDGIALPGTGQVVWSETLVAGS